MRAIPDLGNTVRDDGTHLSRDINGKPKHYLHRIYIRSDASGDRARNMLYSMGYEYHSSIHDADVPMCLYVLTLPLEAINNGELKAA